MKKGFFPGPKAKTNVYKGIYKTEWEFMSDVLRHHGVKQEAILREDKSENTFQNAFYARKITDNANIIINKGIICCKAFHARRCLMYYSWAYPGVEFVVCPTETQNINKNNWFESPEGIERVMGELARCGMQLKEAIDTYKNEGRY